MAVTDVSGYGAFDEISNIDWIYLTVFINLFKHGCGSFSVDYKMSRIIQFLYVTKFLPKSATNT